MTAFYLSPWPTSGNPQQRRIQIPLCIPRVFSCEGCLPIQCYKIKICTQSFRHVVLCIFNISHLVSHVFIYSHIYCIRYANCFLLICWKASLGLHMLNVVERSWPTSGVINHPVKIHGGRFAAVSHLPFALRPHRTRCIPNFTTISPDLSLTEKS